MDASNLSKRKDDVVATEDIKAAEQKRLKKIEMLEKKRKYYQEHKEEKRKLYQENKDSKGNYYQEHKDEIRANYQEHKEEIRSNYQEHREEKLAYQSNYYQEHKENKCLYQNQYYIENKEQRLDYQRKYDKNHKQLKKEYRKLKAHYKKFADDIYGFFEKHTIGHFLSHINGWCGWERNPHEHRWENVPELCSRCHIALFKLICNAFRPYEINALHCIACTQVLCNICGQSFQDHDYYHHFYLLGLNSDLKELVDMCPFKGYLDVTKLEENFACQLCSNEEVQKKRKLFVKIVGIKYRNFLNEKTFKETRIMTNSGKEILVCPYTAQDVQSTICPDDAVKKLAKKINANLNCQSPQYICLDFKFGRTLRHRTEFDHMCELKKHLHLHEDRRVDIHIIELTLSESYGTLKDLRIIDTLLKTNMENLEQVSKIRAIVPAKCLGFDYHYKHRTDAWLAVVDPKCITTPVTSSPEPKYRNDPAINSIMNKIKEEKKTVYMVIHTHEGLVENPVDYFEKLPLYPVWVKESKLLFTWSLKDILMEENKLVQKSLIQAEFIQSKIHPSYFMNLSNSKICGCDCCFPSNPCAINEDHTKPVNGCLLPLIRSPLQASTSPKKSREPKLKLWQEMFLHAVTLKKHLSDDNTDAALTFESESGESSDTDSCENDEKCSENENSDDVWPDL